ncbi:MAG: adenylate/guanylate cyclase domain-containing protein, partial [Lewinella sp.]|nr:adenylate/guanylate cyclase domain-containing protein [Lewinella sp.]
MKYLIPTFVQQEEAAGRRQGAFAAYTLFIDLSGFTPLTESLMREGNAGAERLSNLLNEIFEPLVSLVYARAGFIPYFAGDAFTAIFPETETPRAELLIETAMLARQLFRERENRFGQFTIGLKFGLGYGEVEWGIVGNENRAYYFRGAPIDTCAHCQTLAHDQDIILADDLLAQLPDGYLRLAPVVDNYYRVEGTYDLPPIPPAIELPPLSETLAAHYLPDAVITYSQDGEFRPVVSVFIAFAGIHGHELLDEFSTLVLDQVQTFSGYFKEIDFGDKGGLMAIFFGAPVAFENNIHRALEFALSLREALAPLAEQHRFRVRAGLTVGTAYTGIVGGKERCQYACVGSRVNLAARLMVEAQWGEILVADEIHKASTFRFLHYGDVEYKGIKGAVPTYQLLGRHFGDKTDYYGDLVARHDELAKLADFAQPLYSGKAAGLAYIYGEAGVGKSRLAFELRRLLPEGDRLSWRNCQADQILRKPFNPFIYWMRNYFRQSPEYPLDTNRQNFANRLRLLRRQLEQMPTEVARLTLRELDRTQSILAALMGLPFDNSLWDQLDAQGRYRNTIAAILNLILAE